MGTVRAGTAALVGAWDELPIGRRVPKDASVASLKADVRDGKREPVKHLVRLIFASIDAGVSLDRATKVLRVLNDAATQYAERRQRRQSSGILSFPERLMRLVVRGKQEQCDADVAVLTLDAANLESLEAAARELAEEIAIDQAALDCMRAEIARRYLARG